MSGFTLPPSDRLAATLLRRGARDAATDVLLLSIARADREAPACRVLLGAVRSGTAVDEHEPVDLDLMLVQALLEHSRLYEARHVVQVAGLAEQPVGARALSLLERALLPFPKNADPSFGAVLQLIRAGSAAAAARALDEVVRQTVDPPDWLLDRQRALTALVQGTWREVSGVAHATRDLVLARLRARDLPGALEAARSTGAHELASVLARIVTATDLALSEGRRDDEDDPETSPIEGHTLCEFHLRIGALQAADGGYRAILRGTPDDEKARVRLADVIELRRALGEEPEPLPPRPTRPMDWLRKNAPRTSGGWAAGQASARFGEGDSEETTDALQAPQEAELLLKLGKPEQALDVYRILAIRHPHQQQYRRRIDEIEALIAQRMGPALTEEITVRKDMSALRERAVPTHPKIAMDQFATFADEDDNEITQIDTLPSGDDD